MAETTSRSFDLGLLKEAYLAFDISARKRSVLIFCLLVLSALLEAVGAAMIVPFVAVLSEPTLIKENVIIRSHVPWVIKMNVEGLIFSLSMCLLFFFLAKNIALYWIWRTQFNFIYGQMPVFASRVFSTFLAGPLLQLPGKPSSEVIQNVTSDVSIYFSNVLVPAFTLLTESLVLLAILLTLTLIAPIPTALAVVLLGVATISFFRLVRSRVRRYGEAQHRHNNERIKWVKQAVNSIKEVKALMRGSFFVDQFRSSEQAFADSTKFAMLLNQTPRLFIETVVFIALLLGVCGAIALGMTTGKVLPVLALFGLSAVRILPSINRIMQSVSRIAYHRSSAQTVFRMLSADTAPPMPTSAPVGQRNWKVFVLQNISFAYRSSDFVFSGVNIEIPAGTSIALVGRSGAGKTTLADLMLGLLKPTGGRFLLDGQEFSPSDDAQWRSSLGYIPQRIALLDDTIRRNVAFGVRDKEIDDTLVWTALRDASLEEYVLKQPDGLDTRVGDDGCALSGGERQRIGIARALYGRPKFLVIDEGTSALDLRTEKEISAMLQDLAGVVTTVVIAHRPETIKKCDQIYSIEEQRLL